MLSVKNSLKAKNRAGARTHGTGEVVQAIEARRASGARVRVGLLQKIHLCLILGSICLVGLGARAEVDLGLSTGTYAGEAYSEIHIADNWNLLPFLTFRNSLFTRIASTSILGLDTSLRYVHRSQRQFRGDSGWVLYAGPGLRLSGQNHSGWFMEGGAIFDVAAFVFGLGLKSIVISDPGKAPDGSTRPGSDTNLLLILGFQF